MKVIERATMPNGTKIQLEDWSDSNSAEYPNLYGYTIGAYPIAKRISRYKLVKDGEQFRIDISHNSHTGYTNSKVEHDYEALKSGEKTLEDLSSRFWNGEKDMWYLGMNVQNKGY